MFDIYKNVIPLQTKIYTAKFVKSGSEEDDFEFRKVCIFAISL